MKKSNLIKIFTITLIFIILFGITLNQVRAFGVNELTGTKPTNTDVENAGNKIITVVTTIASVASVVVLIVLGIKYMMGSVEEKAEYKRTLMPYVIGAALAFGASTIAGVIYNIV